MYNIISPTNSFIQFGVSDLITSCEFQDIELCLPVFAENDVWFQFVIEADTEAEADALCDLDNNLIDVGLVFECAEPLSLTFAEKPERFRISPLQVLYNWQHGLPGFADIIDIGECFQIKVIVDGEDMGCSNCLQRIKSDCHTSVIEYGNDDNFAGFNYCNSAPVNEDESVCDPTIISFGPVETLSLAYTASLQAKYGNFPSVEAWGYVGSELHRMYGLTITFNGYPPTVINIDFGGILSGIIKIRK